jgi:MoxR-like ATPase
MPADESLARLQDNLNRTIRGKGDTVERVLTVLFAGGHALIEDVPGVGKTTLCKALAKSLRSTFHRIQFTPDLLPTDILGGMVYSQKDGSFRFRPGPVFCNILLADEINRASPRTQSALLECMSERQVTIEGRTYTLETPYMVVATQNPIEYHGTYPLPEAQLDRFAMQLSMGYPSPEEEVQLVMEQRTSHPLDGLSHVLGVEEVVEMSAKVREVAVEESVVRYATAIVHGTREDSRVKLGASPRATGMLYRCCQSLAFLRGRAFVLPDDVRELAEPVLAHRLALDPKAAYAGLSKGQVLAEVVGRVKVPA